MVAQQPGLLFHNSPYMMPCGVALPPTPMAESIHSLPWTKPPESLMGSLAKHAEPRVDISRSHEKKVKTYGQMCDGLTKLKAAAAAAAQLTNRGPAAPLGYASGAICVEQSKRQRVAAICSPPR